MPCYTISTLEVDAGKMDTAHVIKALEAMGMYPRHTMKDVISHRSGEYNHATGIATWRGQDRTAELKREYSNQILQSQARRFGWTLRTSQNQSGNLKYTIAKR